MGRVYRCNLHIHTCLSPCGSLDMHPAAIVSACRDAGLDMIAVTDHNASENVRYVQEAARKTGLVVIPGMELCTREEVHILALFERLDQLEALQDIVYEHLSGVNDERVFGVQAVVNEHGEVEGFNEHLLIAATELSLEDAVRHIHGLDGLAVPSHIDRTAFGVIGQLGFVPNDVPFDALEVSCRMGVKQARREYPELAGYTMITSSDAHELVDIGRACTRFFIDSPTFPEIRLAFKKSLGRYCLE